MLSIKQVVKKTRQKLLCVLEIVPILWLFEIWALVRVLTVVIIVTLIVSQNVWEDILIPMIDKLLSHIKTST